MERISMYNRTTAKDGDTVKVRFRLVDGRDVMLYHSTGIRASLKDLDKFTKEADLKPRVTVYNKELKADLAMHMVAMHRAYETMKEQGMDLTSAIFEKEIEKVLNPIVEVRSRAHESVYERYVRYIDESYRDGIMGKARHDADLGEARKLYRFLYIKGLTKITAEEFSLDLLLEYRQFIFDEYQYIPKYKHLYPTGKHHHWPTKRLSPNTVVSVLKSFQAFFTFLENMDEIRRSPFRRLPTDRRKALLHTMYDDPVFLRQEEFQKVIDTPVPERLQGTKDAFLLNCCFGCRIGDFMRMTMDKISVSPEGIPYVHYIPRKTTGSQETNREIITPLIRLAYDIIIRTRFNFNFKFNEDCQVSYNERLREIIQLAGIDRTVSSYDHDKRDNTYRPLYEAASSKLARKTHVDIMNKVQVNIYAAGLHREGSAAVNRYTKMEIKDQFALMNVAFDQKPYKVDQNLNLIEE